MTGRQLKALREKMGLTQAGLGSELGYTATQIGRMENGYARVPKVVGIAVTAISERRGQPVNYPEEALKTLKEALRGL